MGCTECTYPILFKVTVNVSCTPNKFVSVKNSVFLGIKKPKTLGLSKQKEQGISTSWFAFCLCSRPLYLKLYSGTRVSRKYHLCHICHLHSEGYCKLRYQTFWVCKQSSLPKPLPLKDVWQQRCHAALGHAGVLCCAQLCLQNPVVHLLSIYPLW